MDFITRSRPFRSLVLFALVAAPFPCAAQTIGGLVLDRQTRLPVRAVEVRVLGDSDVVLAKATTDTTGVFYVDIAAPARVRIAFSLEDVVTFTTDTVSLRADQFLQREFLLELPRVFTDMQVEKQATQLPGTGGLRYPERLKAQNMEGEVLARFVVDTTGRALMQTFRVVRSSHPEFTQAVATALPGMRFRPAEVRGRKVKQVVQQPFTFRLVP